MPVSVNNVSNALLLCSTCMLLMKFYNWKKYISIFIMKQKQQNIALYLQREIIYLQLEQQHTKESEK